VIKSTLAPGIVVYKIDSSKIFKEIESLSNAEWLSEYVVDANDGNKSLDSSYRDTKSIDITAYSREEDEDYVKFFSSLFNKTFSEIEKDYEEDHYIKFKVHQPYKILKYDVGGKFDLHIDDAGATFRRASTVFYLNDNYEGGEIEFPSFDVKYKPQAGDFIMFPSSYAYRHKVNPVISGTRYAIASWLR
jgi:hypothetical protein